MSDLLTSFYRVKNFNKLLWDKIYSTPAHVYKNMWFVDEVVSAHLTLQSNVYKFFSQQLYR